VMQPGTIAALIVFENTWAAPFRQRRHGRRRGADRQPRIPAADVIDALDASKQARATDGTGEHHARVAARDHADSGRRRYGQRRRRTGPAASGAQVRR
jgi:hypothetical protein